MKIRPWVTILLTLVCANSIAANPRPAFPEDPKSHTWEKLGDGIYAFVSPSAITPMVSGNSLVVIGDDSVLVVDTGQFPSLARAEIAKIRQVTKLPVRYIVTTHWHNDHWTGNQEFVRAYPGVSIISTAYTRTLEHTRGAQYVTVEYPGQVLQSVDKAIARGTHSDGKPLLPSERPYLEMAKIQFKRFGEELVGTTPMYSNVTFSENLDIYLGKRLLQIRFLGRGNTGGDAVVFVPDARVLAAGDLIAGPVPYGTASFYSEWVSTLHKLLALDAQIIVPGHGVIERDNAYARQLVQLLESLQVQVAEAIRAGLSLEDTLKRVTLADAMRKSCGTEQFRELCQNSFQHNFIDPAVARTYKEQKNGPLPSED